ncbi:MAG: hypothetical protein RCG15_02560 [Candidatus Rickettsia vulgarisii]
MASISTEALASGQVSLLSDVRDERKKFKKGIEAGLEKLKIVVGKKIIEDNVLLKENFDKWVQNKLFKNAKEKKNTEIVIKEEKKRM